VKRKYLLACTEKETVPAVETRLNLSIYELLSAWASVFTANFNQQIMGLAWLGVAHMGKGSME
jgi:hypothetical protein